MKSKAGQQSIAVETLGCRLNQYESDGILQSFLAEEDGAAAAYRAVSMEDGPDLAIINSCTVTEQADNRSLRLVERLRKKNPRARIVFTGCLAETDAERLQKIPGIDLVVGNAKKSALPFIIKNKVKNNEFFPKQTEGPVLSSAAPSSTSPPPLQNGGEGAQAASLAQGPNAVFSTRDMPYSLKTDPYQIPTGGYGERPVLQDPFAYGVVLPQGHTRAYVKIQDGCNRKCSYCKIPMARGKGVSRPVAEILDHLKKLEDRGVPEIVLTGVNLGWYRDRSSGSDLRFLRLLERMLESLESARLRLSSIEPCDVNGDLGRLSTHPRFCDYLHVPVQSGSRRILKAMRRTYSPNSFLRRIEAVRKHNPGLFLGTDVIVGFPGESESDFSETLELCREVGFAGIHGFRYSARNGTPAALAKNQIPQKELKRRMDRLLALRDELEKAYALFCLGQTRTGILEKIKTASQTEDRRGYGEFLTDNYLRVRLPLADLYAEGLGRGDVLSLQLAEHLQGRFFWGKG